MARPPMPVGTAGRIGFLTVGPKRVRAQVRVRDYDGIPRNVTRYGPTRAAAERRLKEALRDRVGPTEGPITSETKVRDLAVVWLEEMNASDLSDGSKELYERDLRQKVLPAMGALSCREADVPASDRFLKAIQANSGPGKAKSCKTVLSLLLGLAVRHGAIKTNPVRDVAKIKRGKRKERPRALTVIETADAISKVSTDPQAMLQDVVDLMDFMFGTGLRIGEALGLAEDAVDLETGTLEVCQIAVRLSGQGTILQPRPKTDAGWRIIALPPNIVELCRRRIAAIDNPERLLFPGVQGGVRNPSNANRDMKAAIVRANSDLNWVTSHTCRKTVATRLDEAGLSAREIADHLGHAKPSMTQDVYMGRGVASAAAAQALIRDAA
jgi:integrase